MPAGPLPSILGDGSLDDAYLLAVSAVLLQAAHDSGEPPIAALQLLINTLAADLAVDGALDPSCTFSATPDEPYLFTAPADGTYEFHTSSATFDAVLYALDGSCSGPELACSQLPAGDLATLQSR